MKARITLEIDANEINDRLPESVQLKDLSTYVLSRLGFAKEKPGHPKLKSVSVKEAVCTSSTRHTTPIEGTVVQLINDVTEITRKTVIDPDPSKRKK